MDYIREILALGIDSVYLGLCYTFYVEQCSAIKRVQNAAVLDLNPELEDIVKTHPDNKIPYVAIRGTVAALGAPITSVNNQNITGTIQKLSVKEHVFARSSAGFWSDQERAIQEVYNSVPFILQASNASVEVLDALRADVLDLETVADHFEPSSSSVFDLVWVFLQVAGNIIWRHGPSHFGHNDTEMVEKAGEKAVRRTFQKGARSHS
ncbi:mitochondrial E3 ubiquitin protein ligase 1-like [Periplaneta americana]|uniref:mitochondrial E3 ubiquitin protein ligase 1-like n=1 Tax=Periplaneta americana TaxID=6978 RepID=UPI0037E9AE0A